MHIYLLGYRGSGKTTVAVLLSQVLDLPMIDTDDWIESSQGATIRELFQSMGESGFREIEHQIVAQVANLSHPAVVALGGGAILRDDNQQLLRTSGRCIWLRASPQQLHARIQSDSSSPTRRPSLTDRSEFEEVAKLLEERTPIYASMADLSVDTGGLTPDQIVEKITDWIKATDLPPH